MTVYIILIFALSIFGLWTRPRFSQRGRKLFIIFSFLAMFVVSGFRDFSVGVDTKSYVAIFNAIDYYGVAATRFEPGFILFVRLIHSISDNPALLIVISSAICIGTTCLFIYRYSEDPLLAILLYIVLKPYFFQMTGMRQALASSLVMLAFYLILENRTRKRIILGIGLVLLATQFHNMSAVAFIPFFMWLFPAFRLKEKITPTKMLKFTIVLAIFSFVFYSYIMRLVVIISPQYAHYFSGIWSDSNYFASLFKMLIQLVFMVVGVLYFNNKELTEMDRFSLIMISISVVVGTLAMRMEIWGRLTGLFSIYTSILYAPSFSSSVYDAKNRMFLKTAIFFLSFVFMLVTFIFRPEWDGVVPYLFRG